MIYARLEVTAQPGPSSDQSGKVFEKRQLANGTDVAADGKVRAVVNDALAPWSMKAHFDHSFDNAGQLSTRIPSDRDSALQFGERCTCSIETMSLNLILTGLGSLSWTSVCGSLEC